MRVVLDTNILARAHQRAQGPARRVLLHLISGPDVLVLSPHILVELERVLSYPRLLKRSGLNSRDVAEYLESLAELSSLVSPAAVPGSILRDPSDSPILGTALAGKADVLCTRDADLFDEAVRQFCDNQNIRLLTDLEFIDTFGI